MQEKKTVATDEGDKTLKTDTFKQDMKQGAGTTVKRPTVAIRASENELRAYLKLVSTKYGQDYETMANVINCESGWRVDPPHNGVSLGISQFTVPTWHDFGFGDIMNPYSQIEVMGMMWEDGLQKRWDCYKLVL